jgi:hypothetical protein
MLAPVCSMATATTSVKLADDMVTAILSSGVANITHFKNRSGISSIRPFYIFRLKNS